MASPDISIVIPLFNKRAFIGRALDSIATQRLAPDEVIVVDDGSTDDSFQIVAAYEGLPIRLVRQKNSGVSVARNRGVQEARCGWVAFLDADDEYLPSALEDLREARDRSPEACVVFGRSVPDKAFLADSKSERHYLPVPDYFAYLLARGAEEVHSSSVMCRKSAIEEAGLFPPGIRIGEDTDTWMRLGCLFTFVRVVSPVSIYHIADGDSAWQTKQGSDPHWYGTYESWLDEGRIPVQRRRSAMRYFEFCRLQTVIYLARTGKRASALRNLFTRVSWLVAPKKMLAKSLLIALFPAILRWTRRKVKAT